MTSFDSIPIFKEIAGQDGNRIVLLNWDGQSPTFCNLLRIDNDGNVLWKTTPHHPLEGVWTDVRFEDDRLIANNFAGYLDEIDCNSGVILNRTIVK